MMDCVVITQIIYYSFGLLNQTFSWVIGRIFGLLVMQPVIKSVNPSVY